MYVAKAYCKVRFESMQILDTIFALINLLILNML